MRYVIFSDIHGNLEALNAFTEAVKKENADELICLGDLVGYGADPNECIEVVRGLTKTVLAGNHDHAALELTDISLFNNYAKSAILWTRDSLTEDNKSWLRKLPLTGEFADFMIVHATPREPVEWLYILTIGEARDSFEAFDQKICFIGHSHQVMAVSRDGEENFNTRFPSSFKLQEGLQYIINVGSVGQPRDRDNRSSYVVYDTDCRQIEFKRVKYDIIGAQEKIIKAGLPPYLAERLASGR